jgi:PEP-CTERM motif
MKMFPQAIAGAMGITAALAFSVSSTQAQNLLVDPGFELGISTPNPITQATVGDGWALFGGSFSTAYPEAGSSSMVIGGNAGWSGVGAYQVISAGVTPGLTYDLSGDYHAAPGSDTGLNLANSPLVQLGFLDASFNTIGSNVGSLQTGTPAFDQSGNSAPWSTASVTDTAPAGAVYAVAYFMIVAGPGDNIYVDNTSLTAVPEPATIALLGMGLAFPLYLIRRRK